MSIRTEWAERSSSSARHVAALRGRLVAVPGAPEDVAPEGAAVLWFRSPGESFENGDWDGIIYCPGDAPTAIGIRRGERPGRILQQVSRAFGRDMDHEEPREIKWSSAINVEA